MVGKRNWIRVAAVQMGVTGNQPENMTKICSFIKKASQEGVEAVVFPEYALSGYPSSEEPVDIADMPSLGKIDFQIIERNLTEIMKLAQKLSIWVVLGTARYRNNCWYNDALLLSDKGAIEGVYAKTHLSKGEIENFIQGNSFPVMDIKGISVGFQICRDMRFPEPWRILKAMGAKIVFLLSHYRLSEARNSKWMISLLEGVLRTRASTNGYFVISANDAGPLQVFPSVIIDPKGRKLAQATMETEEMITANLNLKQVNDNYFKSRRLDLYRLHLRQ